MLGSQFAGRYRLDARFEESSVLGTGGTSDGASGQNPILKIVKGRSQVTLNGGDAA